jgi:hypothetical protein
MEGIGFGLCTLLREETRRQMEVVLTKQSRLGWTGEGVKDISEPREPTEVRLEPEYIEELERIFPNLKREGYRPTSEVADRPNCIGWALYDYKQYWDPSMIGVKGYYWPPGVARDDSLDSWIKVFEIHSYQLCASAEFEPDFEKIAVYANPDTGTPGHVARQKKSGVWVSKLGSGADVEHNNLEALICSDYGIPVRFMKRPRHPEAE